MLQHQRVPKEKEKDLPPTTSPRKKDTMVKMTSHLVIIIINIFLQHKIVSGETILSTYPHIHWYRHPHIPVDTPYTIYNQLQQIITKAGGGGRQQWGAENTVGLLLWKKKSLGVRSEWNQRGFLAERKGKRGWRWKWRGNQQRKFSYKVGAELLWHDFSSKVGDHY